MLSENVETSNVQDEKPVQEEQTVEQPAVQDNDLQKEQAYAKKQRQRAQVAEEELANLKKDLAEKKTAQLAEQGKYKEMYTELADKARGWEADAKEYQSLVKSEKNDLLEQLPEEDREVFKDLGLKQLRKVVAKVTTPKPDVPKAVPGTVKDQPIEQKQYADMTPEERATWHNNIMQPK